MGDWTSVHLDSAVISSIPQLPFESLGAQQKTSRVLSVVRNTGRVRFPSWMLDVRLYGAVVLYWRGGMRRCASVCWHGLSVGDGTVVYQMKSSGQQYLVLYLISLVRTREICGRMACGADGRRMTKQHEAVLSSICGAVGSRGKRSEYHGIEPMNGLFTFNPIRLGKGLAKAWQRALYFRLAIRVT